MQDVTAHSWDASKAALPAWSLPKDAVDRIALPVRLARASHARLGARRRDGRRRAGVHPRLGRRPDASARRRARERSRHLDRRGRRGHRRRGHGGRRVRTRHRLRRDRAPARARVEDLERPRPRIELHRLGRRAPGRPSLRDRAGLRRHQHEPLDDEEAVREHPPRARRQRLLQADRARRLGAQHAGRELSVALLVGHLGREPRGARSARLLLQPEPARRVLRPRRERRGALARRPNPHRVGKQLRDAAHDARSAP